MDNVRFGLVGFGAWGGIHAGAIANTANAEITAIAARSESTCQSARDAFPSAFVTTDYRELVARDDVDVVDIVVPSHLHFEIASAALNAGKHVLLEKPMALTVAHCDQLIQLAAAQGKLLTVDHELRFSSLWAKVKDLIDDGFVGEPQYCLLELSRRPYRLGADGWAPDAHAAIALILRNRFISSIWLAGISPRPGIRRPSMPSPIPARRDIRSCRTISARSSTIEPEPMRSFRRRWLRSSIIKPRRLLAPKGHCGPVGAARRTARVIRPFPCGLSTARRRAKFQSPGLRAKSSNWKIKLPAWCGLSNTAAPWRRLATTASGPSPCAWPPGSRCKRAAWCGWTICCSGLYFASHGT